MQLFQINAMNVSRVKKAEKNDEKIKQQNCPYCHSHDIHGTKEFKCNYDKACAWIELDDKVITFDNADGGRTFGEFEINYCPICGRKLEA